MLTPKEIAYWKNLILRHDRGLVSKKEFTRIRKKWMNQLIQIMGLEKADYDLRYNAGGPAVMGEVTLHTDKVYVQLLDSQCGPIMFRTVTGRKDYSGGANHWGDFAEVEDIEKFARNLKRIMERDQV